MAARSVVQIDVESEAFKEFYALYSRYEESLKQMPGDWGKVSAAFRVYADAQKAGFAQGVSSTRQINDNAAAAVRSQNELTRAAKGSDAALKGVERTARGVAEYVERTTFQLLKWAALGGGLGAGVLGGAAALAQAGNQQLIDASMLGMTTGQLRAARDVYGTMGIGVDSLLANLRNMQTDQRKAGFLKYLGIGGADLNKSPGELLPRVLENLAAGAGRGQPYYEATHLNEVAPFALANMLRNLPQGKLAERTREYTEAAQRLEQPADQQRAMQDAIIHIKEAGDQLQNLFTPAVVAASKGVTRLASWLNSDQFGDMIGHTVDKAKALADQAGGILPVPGTQEWHDQALNTWWGQGLDFISQGVSDALDQRREWAKRYMSDAAFEREYGMPKRGDVDRGKVAPHRRRIRSALDRRMLQDHGEYTVMRDSRQIHADLAAGGSGEGIFATGPSYSYDRAGQRVIAQQQQAPLVTGKVVVENNTGGNATTTATLLQGH